MENWPYGDIEVHARVVLRFGSMTVSVAHATTGCEDSLMPPPFDTFANSTNEGSVL
jgi:hypothetical protein